MNIKNLFASFKPSFDPVSISEKFKSAFAALLGMLFLGEILRLLPDGGQPLILFASMAAASVLLYAVPHSPMAQPWPLLVGNLLSGAVGLLCSAIIPDPVIAVACAVGVSIFVMHMTHSLHPPGAATSMIMVLNAAQLHHYGWLWAGSAVLANAIFSLLLALVFNHFIHAGRYPVTHHILPTHRNGVPFGVLAGEDIKWALGKMEGFIDANEEDLLEIFRLATEHAQKK
ncbi:MAG: HPP family protein [Nitrosomonadales bacterium]